MSMRKPCKRFVAEGKTFWRSMLAIAMARSTDPVGQRLVAQARRRLAYAAPATLEPDDARSIHRWLSDLPVGFGGIWQGTNRYGYRVAVVHHGLDEFVVIDPRASAENGPVLTFRRHGLGWKLEAVRYGQQ